MPGMSQPSASLIPEPCLTFPFEKLHLTFVALGGGSRGERTQVSLLPRARIAFAGIQAILA